jgi:hypothetical protein
VIINIKHLKTQYITLDPSSPSSSRLVDQLVGSGFVNFEPVMGVKEEIKRVGVAKAFLKALKENTVDDKPFLILENDAYIWHDWSELEIPDNADAIYLGISRYGVMPSSLNSYYTGSVCKKMVVERQTDDIYRIYNMLSAHAVIIISPEYRDFLIRAISFAIRIGTNQDRVRADSMKYWKVYALDKPMFYQNDASDLRQEESTKNTISDLVKRGEFVTDISIL